MNYYTAIAKTYDLNLFYDIESPIVQAQIEAVLEIMWPQSGPQEVGDTLVDLGAGTCAFSAELARRRPDCTFIFVEPNAQMAAQGRKRCSTLKNASIVEATAADFLATYTPTRDTMFLCKEMMHHCVKRDRLFAQMKAAKKVLMIERPQKCVYPFCPTAVEAWEKSTCRPETFVDELKTSFSNVVLDERLLVNVSMPTTEWTELVRSRFWSNLAEISDADMNAGLCWIKEKFPDEISFPEKEIFIIGTPL
eukprot:GEMP01032277.1.p1 GENE.GEMP01032277.1~~GEMP01032277.1.p1  ORF type:complete len:250 (-),score=40.37 GEMP01032277.1:1217-1966(-)